MVTEPLKWYEENANNPPWIKVLAEVRHRATREGWCYQYAEAALGNREFFLTSHMELVAARRRLVT
jgi:hypothetical protein